MSAYHFKYFQNIQFKITGSHQPPDLPTLKAYPTPGVGGRFGIFSLKWRERMNLKVPRAILPLGCAILSTRAKTVRGLVQPPLGELGLTAHIWREWKSTFRTCHCHKISWEEAVGLKQFIGLLSKSQFVWICEIWDNFVKNLNFVNNCLVTKV